ncbi:MAG: 4-alpha-glucanotransferase [Actinomycetota bacterium]|nr:4-alpha-glucanotransferase [Actinomycetota bacterium]
MRRRPNKWGVHRGYKDNQGRWHRTSASTLERITSSISKGADQPPTQAPVIVITATERRRLQEGVVILEDGTEFDAQRSTAHLPLGYHTLLGSGANADTRLIVAPPICRSPEPGSWGWVLQLYSLVTPHDWGIGDLKGLQEFGSWASRSGASMVMVNPLSATLPTVPKQSSPYYPSSRCFNDPLYLSMADIETSSSVALDSLAPQIERAKGARYIDRDSVYQMKMQTLWDLFDETRIDTKFSRFEQERGDHLEKFAMFQAISESTGLPWRRWDPSLRTPSGAGLPRFAADNSKRVRFHKWIQFLLDEQVARANAACGVVQDLAIGVDPDGADAWYWQDAFATNATVGAPPDGFNQAGQDWSLPPLDPWALRSLGYEPFIQAIRFCLRHGTGLRIDHVMGMFRLYWIPTGMDPSQGAYVSYPYEDLLKIIALESHRASSWVVGEDLGTVDKKFQKHLAKMAILSYRLFIFDGDVPRRYPLRSMAAATTHDLPTLVGLWDGSDIDEQLALGLEPNMPATNKMIDRVFGETKPAGIGAEQAVTEVYQKLAAKESLVVAVTMEDALKVSTRPNMPGTVDERPNWRIRLPLELNEITSDRYVNSLATAVNDARAKRRSSR